MAKREAVALNESIPQLQVPQTGDTYQFVRDVFLTTGVIKSEVADGASAVGVVLDTENSFANATSKLVSIRNSGTEKAYFDRHGRLDISGADSQMAHISIRGTPNYYGGAIELGCDDGWWRLGNVVDRYQIAFTFNASKGASPGGATIPFGLRSTTEIWMGSGTKLNWGSASGNMAAAGDTGLIRTAAAALKVTNGSTGLGELLFKLPTSDPGVTGALWNNSGTVVIS